MDEGVLFESKLAWLRWLETHHTDTQNLWLKIAKKNSGAESVTYAEALDIALCFGWIDGQKRPFDERFFLQRFSIRGKNSIWSKINREKVLVLTEAGEMRPQGLAEVERAKANGRWDAAYDGSKTIQVPKDLEVALVANPKAMAFFKTLNAQNRYAILFRIGNVKKAETRAHNIAKFVAMLEQGKTIYP